MYATGFTAATFLRAACSCGFTLIASIGNGPGHGVLERQRVTQLTLITLRPEVPVRGAFDQLRRDADLVSGTQHRAFDDRIHVQLARDVGKRLATASL